MGHFSLCEIYVFGESGFDWDICDAVVTSIADERVEVVIVINFLDRVLDELF